MPVYPTSRMFVNVYLLLTISGLLKFIYPNPTCPPQYPTHPHQAPQ